MFTRCEVLVAQNDLLASTVARLDMSTELEKLSPDLAENRLGLPSMSESIHVQRLKDYNSELCQTSKENDGSFK